VMELCARFHYGITSGIRNDYRLLSMDSSLGYTGLRLCGIGTHQTHGDGRDHLICEPTHIKRDLSPDPNSLNSIFWSLHCATRTKPLPYYTLFPAFLPTSMIQNSVPQS